MSIQIANNKFLNDVEIGKLISSLKHVSSKQLTTLFSDINELDKNSTVDQILAKVNEIILGLLIISADTSYLEYEIINEQLRTARLIGIKDKTKVKDVFILPEVINDYTIIEIGPKVFEDCINLKSILIPDTVVYIDETAFDGCTGLPTDEHGVTYTFI